MRLERLPDYCRTSLPECKRLTRVVATMDPKLVACWNGRSQRYELWGPSKSEGWVVIAAVEAPDGSYCHPDAYPMFMLAELRRRDRPLNVQAMCEEQAKAAEREWRAAMDELGEAAKYVAKACAAEAVGALRHGSKDVLLGLRLANEGRSRAPRQGQIFLPGRGV